MKFNKALCISIISAALILFSGCGVNSVSGSSSSNSSSSSGGSKSTAKSGETLSAIFAFYNKVKLGQTKDEIDAALAVKPVADTNAQNLYEYNDPKAEYRGVSVLYDKNNKATTKTVLYSSHSEIAPFCKKAVTKQQADRITNNMTYDQVKELLGGEGVEVMQSDTELSGKVSLLRRWANSNGSCIQIFFRSDETVLNATYYANDY